MFALGIIHFSLILPTGKKRVRAVRKIQGEEKQTNPLNPASQLCLRKQTSSVDTRQQGLLYPTKMFNATKLE
ncbi:hypothetical protein XELAEV_18024312mg [Xenopus laevis]|uniref:Uncharacterized protein n=1 Tax=Xenopus laevis TaxID=8355 RepID=A0A974CXS0_XENLA|nr:hypothetical protein XELAEV_18024312mg [Xenopus laevis]